MIVPASDQQPGTGHEPAGSGSSHPSLRSVAMPKEHGGWGLTIEPGVLGLLVRPDLSGLCLALAAIVVFVARTPAELALVDRRRQRRLPRTRLAERVAGVELIVLAGLVAATIVLADDGRWWIPLAAAAPLAALELLYDIRSRRRRLVPELAGSIAIAAVATAVVVAGGGSFRLGVGLWLILAARAITSIPHVRAQIARLRGRAVAARLTNVADGLAVLVAIAATVLDDRLVVGAVTIAVLAAIQRVRRGREVAPPKVIGISQMLFGFALVAATAIGVAVV